MRAKFAAQHIQFWEWGWALQRGRRPQPFVAVWARGGAKSSSAELAAACVVMRGSRRYVVYVSATQDLADKHVATIAALLEGASVERAVNRYGSSKGWRRNRLRTSDGATIDALGLDTATRGIKVDMDRPDMLILDDIDERHDSADTTEKKTETLTNTILPAGANDCAVLGVQNLIHANSIFAKLVDGRADYLSDRIVSGPFKAIDNLTYDVRNGEVVITGGTATWDGQSIADCQNFIKTWSLRAFLRECQHEVRDAENALWKNEILDALRVTELPNLIRVGTALDPSGNDGGGDECGIVTAGIGMCACKGFAELHAFVLDDASLSASPEKWAKAGVGSYHRHGADVLIAEGNYGGAMVSAVIGAVPGAPKVKIIHASRGKQARAEPVSVLYDEGKVHHVGYFQFLEREMTTWEPKTGARSPNRLDALVWILTELMLSAAKGETRAAFAKARVKKVGALFR